MADLHAGAFSGAFFASFLTEELVAFRSRLRALYETLQGEAVFHTLEGQLTLSLAGDGRGAFPVRGRLSK